MIHAEDQLQYKVSLYKDLHRACGDTIEMQPSVFLCTYERVVQCKCSVKCNDFKQQRMHFRVC